MQVFLLRTETISDPIAAFKSSSRSSTPGRLSAGGTMWLDAARRWPSRPTFVATIAVDAAGGDF
jgi:hypothetical protein